jgi:hypothetical protein
MHCHFFHRICHDVAVRNPYFMEKPYGISSTSQMCRYSQDVRV